MQITRQRNKQTIAIIQMLLCAMLWSTAGLFIKLVPWHPFIIAGFRSLIAAAVTYIYMRAVGLKFRFSGQVFVGGLFMCLTFFAFMTANKLTTAANAIALQYTQPVWIMLFSALFLKQKFKLIDILAAVGTLGGISLFFLDELAPGNWVGNLLGVLAGAFMAVMFIVVGNSNKEERVSATLLGHMMTAVVGLPFLAFNPIEITTTAVLSVLALGVFQLGISYILMVNAFEHCPPLACSLLSAVEPIFNPVWVFLFSGEAPGMFALIGAVVVIGVVTLWCLWRDGVMQKGKTPAQAPK